MNNIIPFGKYKGQPIETIQNDKQYLDWLQSQEWFKSRYQQLNTIIINNFNEPSETPEHNKLQVKFLDQDFLRKFWLKLIEKRMAPKYYKYSQDITIVNSTNKAGSFFSTPSLLIGVRNCLALEIPETLKPKKFQKSKFVYNKLIPIETKLECQFEVAGVDVVFNVPYHCRYNIELKPNISDDYPAIFRQAIANKCHFVITESYTGTGATLKQVKDIFWSQKVCFVLISEILA